MYFIFLGLLVVYMLAYLSAVHGIHAQGLFVHTVRKVYNILSFEVRKIIFSGNNC